MSLTARLTDPHPEAIPFLASIPLVESNYAPRGSILHVKRHAFIDAPTVPALVMHSIDYEALQVSAETGKPMGDLSVGFEALRRHIEKRINRGADRALRRIDRMHRDNGERRET